MLEKFELRAAREREVSKKLKEELLIFKKEVVEQYEKGFNKVVRQAEFFRTLT